MIDLSETGFIGIITNILFTTSLFIAVKDLVYYIKGKISIFGSVIFFLITILIFTVGLLTDYIRFDSLGIIVIIVYLLTLLVALKFKKTVLLFWLTVLVLIIGLFIAFISYTLKDTENILKVNITKVDGKFVEGCIYYNNIIKEFKVESDMFGFESFQILIKPYINFLFGGRRIIVTSFFTEVFNDSGIEGKTKYYPLGETIINRRELWKKLEAKKIILIGFDGVQRTNVSIYPRVGRYVLKWKDSLYLLKEE
ncbi:MAG TPA: hypothetical protein PKW55_08730 [Spirochaetota bacterium]|nr:hypothetical protein [Spirochaetota bacterium]HOM39161.1 hypothetical protein [Spirochaetota bacterium]HPQ48338.1 hypothetical protein [Spirochaetota bacterium]